MRPKNVRSSFSICAAFCVLVFANPKASDASPSPVNPASVPRRTKSHTVRAVARIGSSSRVVTRSFGAASRKRGRSASPAAAFAPLVSSDRRFIFSLYGPALGFSSRGLQVLFDARDDLWIAGSYVPLLTGIGDEIVELQRRVLFE